MKPNHLFTSMLAVTALFVASCSTSKLAQNSAIQDDVYNTTAQAKEYKEVAKQEQTVAQNNEQVSDYYGTSDPYYDMDYSTRINRFYYANPWRTYYDGYYGFDSYLFSPYSYGFGMGMYGGLNNWLSPYSYYGFYGAPYYNNYWGLYSYNNPYYGGGGHYGGGGYYGSIGRGASNANYGARPTRGSENGVNRANGTSYNGYPNGVAARTSSSSSRAERYNPTNNTSGGTRTNGTTSSTPTRSTSSSDSRPTRSSDSPTARTYSPPQQSSPPPSSSSSGSSSRGSSSGSSSSGSGGGRPTRGGGR